MATCCLVWWFLPWHPTGPEMWFSGRASPLPFNQWTEGSWTVAYSCVAGGLPSDAWLGEQMPFMPLWLVQHWQWKMEEKGCNTHLSSHIQMFSVTWRSCFWSTGLLSFRWGLKLSWNYNWFPVSPGGIGGFRGGGPHQIASLLSLPPSPNSTIPRHHNQNSRNFLRQS